MEALTYEQMKAKAIALRTAARVKLKPELQQQVEDAMEPLIEMGQRCETLVMYVHSLKSEAPIEIDTKFGPLKVYASKFVPPGSVYIMQVQDFERGLLRDID